MRRLTIILCLALAACDSEPPEPTESFPFAWCKTARTGVTGVRKWEVCHPVGKNPCGTKTQHEAPTEQFLITCRKLLTQDTSVAKLPPQEAKRP